MSKFQTAAASVAISVAVFAASLSAAASDATRCETKLQSLRNTQATFLSQLANIPPQVDMPGSQTVNRLYEQLMLENISALSQISALDERCMALDGGTEKEKCMAEKDALLAKQQVFDQQLQNVPSTINQPAIQVPNRLYEQLMLESITAARQISALEASCTNPTTALTDTPQNTDKAGDIVLALRGEIDMLKTLVADLSVENRKLSALVAKLGAQSVVPTHADLPLSCVDDYLTAVEKREKLKSHGYLDNHPDIRSLSKHIRDVKSDCPLAETTG